MSGIKLHGPATISIGPTGARPVVQRPSYLQAFQFHAQAIMNQAAKSGRLKRQKQETKTLSDRHFPVLINN